MYRVVKMTNVKGQPYAWGITKSPIYTDAIRQHVQIVATFPFGDSVYNMQEQYVLAKAMCRILS